MTLRQFMARLSLMTAALLLISTVAWAQQSQELTQKYYPEPEGVSFTTPSFVYPCDDATNHASYTDIMTWISERVDMDPRAALSYVGKTADGYDIPLVRIHDSSRGKAGSKVKVYFQGVLHVLNSEAGSEQIRKRNLILQLRKTAVGRIGMSVQLGPCLYAGYRP